MTDQICVTIEDPGDAGEGAPVAAVVAALAGVEDAMRLMVEHLGDRQPGPGRPPNWVRDQSRLRVTAIRPGPAVADLQLDAPRNG